MEALEGVRRRTKTEGVGTQGDDDVPAEEGRTGDAAQICDLAEGMFASMCVGFEKAVVTEENMEDAIRHLANAYMDPTRSLARMQDYVVALDNIKSYIRKLLQEIIKNSSNQEVTSELFYETVLHYSEGKISLFELFDDIIPPAAGGGKPGKANLGTLLNHPFRALKFLKQSALKSVEKQSSRWVWSNFTSKQLYWLLAVYFLPMMTVQVIVASVSMALFTGAILFMLLVTMQIVIDSERVQSQVEYFSLFQLFNTKGDQLHPPVQKSDILHYVVFLVGLMVAIVTLGLSNQSFVYYEVLVILSAVISFLVMVQFDLHESSLFWLFILAKSLSWVVVIIEKLCALFTFSPPPFLNPDTLSDPVFTLPLFDELTFEISPLTIVQVTFHVCLLATQLKNLDWKLFFSKLGPHILFFCWFVLCRFFVSHSSAKHLAIISTAIALFPFTTFTFLVSPIIFLYRYGLTVPFYFSVVSVIIVSIFSVLAFVSFKYWKSWWLNRSLEYVLLGVLVLLFGLVLFLSAWYSSIFQLGTPTSPVTVEEYGRYCGPKNWLDGNMVQTQINCMHLRGREFSAHADVESVSISEAVDGMANSIKLFPLFLQRAITCHLGSVAPMCGDHKDMSTCVYNGCHFQHTLTYTFEIKLKIPIENEGSVKATLIVSNHHKEFVLNLKSGMSLQFNAAFVDGMGSDHLTLRALFLDAPGLDNTQSLEEERKEKIRQNMWSVFHQGVKNGVLVILEIFFGYAL